MLDPSVGRWFGEDPIDFGAGDASLYRYVGNNPTNATDPSGLQAAGVKVDYSLDPDHGVPTATLKWSFVMPVPPAGWSVYTHVTLSWELVKGKQDPIPPRKGRYEYWLAGLPAVNAVDINLSSKHGSHNGPRNTDPAYEIFPVAGKEAKEQAYKEHQKAALDARGIQGAITAVFEFRAYRVKPDVKFNTAVMAEKGGPFEFQGENKNLADGPKGLYKPNRLRTSYRVRDSLWTGEMPDFWKGDPDWRASVSLRYRWDTSSTDDVFGIYSVQYNNDAPLKGATFYPPPLGDK